MMPKQEIHWRDVLLPDMAFLEIIARGTLIYLALFFMLRLVLKRQSGSLEISDLLLIVLIADAAQNAMAGGYHSVPDGIVLVATLIFWSFALDWLGYHFPRIQKFVHPPALQLIKDGKLIPRNMKRELITEDELFSQLREQGIHSIAEVEQAFMEGDGKISVTPYKR